MNSEFEAPASFDLNPADQIKIHQYYLDHFYRIEQSEELRSENSIKFFLTLSTIVTALLISPGLGLSKNYLAIFFFLLILFALGLLIFARVIWSDRRIKQHQQLWGISHKNIQTFEPNVRHYSDFLSKMDDYRICFMGRTIKGTYTQIIMFTEAILFAVSFYYASIFLRVKWYDGISLSIILAVIIFLMLLLWGWYVKNLFPQKTKSSSKSTNG